MDGVAQDPSLPDPDSPEIIEQLREMIQKDMQRREAEAAWELLDQIKQEFDALFDHWQSLKDSYAAAAIAAAPRPQSASLRLATNRYGARFSVPHGRYAGDGLLGAMEVIVRQGETERLAARVLTRGQPGLRQIGHGWTFEPGAMLKEYYTVVSVEPGFRTTCRAVKRFSYVSADESILFQNRGIEQACSYQLEPDQSPVECEAAAASRCDASQPTQYWSTHGQVALDVSDRERPVVRFPDGRSEVMASGGSHLPFNEGLFDNLGPQGVNIRSLTFTKKRLDRNGNVTRYFYANGFVDTVADPRGRETRYLRDSTTGRVLEIRAPGPGGTEHTWSMTWAGFNWSPSQVLPDFPCVADDRPLTCPDLSYTTLTRLRVPDGREFAFTYEPWGALKTAVAPGGMTTEFRYGTAGTPTHPPVRFSQSPQFIDRIDQRRLTETIVTVLGDDGPRRTTIEHEPAEPLTENTNRDCLFIRWIKQTQPDGTVVRQGLCSRSDNNTFDTTFEATNGRVMAQEVRDSAGQLIEGTYYGNTGVPGAPGHVGNMYVAWETADAPNTDSHAKGDVLDVRQTKVFHLKDGVTWTEEMDYEESNIPANESCPGCPTFRTWGGEVARRILNGAGTPLAETRTSYFHPGAYRARNLLRLPATVELVDLQTGQVMTRRESRYDETPLVPSGLANLDDVGTARGNPTSVLAHKLTAPGAVTTQARFFDTGDVFESTDANGNTTTTNLDFRLCAETPTLTSSVTNALGHTATTLTDCSSALVLRVTDANGQRTCTKYDSLGRVVEVAGPGDALTPGGVAAPGCGGSQGPTATTEYFLFGREVSDIGEQRTVVRAKDGSPDRYVKTFTDGQGRTVQIRTEVDPATSGGFPEVVATTEYDRMGRVAKAHVPCFGPARDAKTDCENPKFTATTYDALARVTSVTPPGLPPTTTDYGSEAGNWTTLVTPVQDEARQKRTKTTILGHTIETAAKWSGCGGCWLTTTMAYDVAGRLLSATDPGGNTMSMTYDGLGRKRSLTDPDMGGFAGRSWTYDYDDNGNLITQTDAKGQTIRMCYDALNRIILKDLPPASGGCDRATAGPEDVTYFYDGDLPPPPPTCEFAISPASASVPSQGGSGVVGVTADSTCDWTAVSNVPWMTLTPASGLGSGTVSFTVDANPGSTGRTGTATIAGQTFSITQDGDVVCTFSVDPTSQSFPVGGGTGTIQVTGPAGCSWAATAGAGWITITGGATGSGNGTVAYTVAANGGAARGSAITVAGLTISISQAGTTCSVVLDPTIAFPPGTPASTGSFTVTAPPGCTWTAVSRDSWITVTGGASGSGNGTVSYSVAVNDSGVTRLGRIDVADQVFTVEQGPNAGCPATVNPANPVIPASSGTHSVSLTINAGCTWRAQSDETTPWITLLPPTEGTGPATISYSVTANTGTKSRQGVFVVGDKLVSVTQLAPCSASISPTSQSFPGGGGSGSVAVTIPAGCTWTASSSVGWVTITGGASGTGNGTVSYSVAANPGTNSRSAPLTIAGLTFTVSQDPAPPCAPGSYSIAPTAQNFPNGGGTGSVSVTATAGCPWTAASNVGWVTITSGFSGSGNGTVTFSVGVNPQSDNTPPPPRSGTLTIAGQTFTVNQGVVCSYTVSPTSASLPSGGGAGSVSVTAPAGCSWTVSSGAPWITVTSGGGGSGNGTVAYSVAANTGAARTGTIAIAGQTVTISQAAPCSASFAISPTSASVGAGGGTGTVSVSAGAGCPWTATSNATWVTITAGASGTGSGTVSYSVAANSGSSSRTGTLTIAGQTFTVTQASGCVFTLSPTSFALPSGASTGSVSITVPAGCAWTAVSNSSWLTITSGASGSGNGTVTFSATANGGAARTGSLTVAGQTVTVTQAAGCSFTLSATNLSFGNGAGNGSVGVTAPAGCAWTATSNASWLTITAGASGTGSGTVSFSVQANTTPSPRTGTLTIAGQTVTVTQAAAAAVPAAPSGLTAYYSEGVVSLSWFDNSGNETAFRLERRTGNSAFAEIAVLAANESWYVDADVSPSNSYTYRVRACNANGCSAYSNEAMAWTY